jgi:lipopolysaccharide/colanic/teichoic acid biosynthesis glycosyltransferase
MAKRLFDILASVVGLILFGPVILIAAIGVRWSSDGPAFYCPARAGLGGKPFTLYKLRTMHLGGGSRITAAGDQRVFTWGRILRKTKVDELPQLWNILRGDMSFVGPRPEDTEIVATAYGRLGHASLTVRPGLAGVSSLYNYTHGEQLLDAWGGDTELAYKERLLPVKLALEAVYIRRASLAYDIRLVLRTVATLFWMLTGRTEFPEPPEMGAANELLKVATSQRAA